MADSRQIIAAARDEDLRQRLIALAAKQGVENPDHWVLQHIHQLVSADLDGSGEAEDSIATVYDYAAANYVPAPRPGQNLAAVTDPHITAAIDRVIAATNKPEEAPA